MTPGPARHRPSTTSPLVRFECERLTRTYRTGSTTVHAVRAVSCTITSGARIAVTGPSGSGKSTLLHLLAGLESPTSGSVRWPGLRHDRNGRPVGVGVVFQGPSLLPSLDVTENVALPMIFMGISAQSATRRAITALDLLGITDLAAKLPDELSGGQSQRVAIARVLATRPAVILCDEPTGQLDHDTAHRVITVLLDTADAIGAALIVSTHDDLVADRLTSRWCMHDGVLDTGPAPADPTQSELPESDPR